MEELSLKSPKSSLSKNKAEQDSNHQGIAQNDEDLAFHSSSIDFYLYSATDIQVLLINVRRKKLNYYHESGEPYPANSEFVKLPLRKKSRQKLLASWLKRYLKSQNMLKALSGCLKILLAILILKTLILSQHSCKMHYMKHCKQMCV